MNTSISQMRTWGPERLHEFRGHAASKQRMEGKGFYSWAPRSGVVKLFTSDGYKGAVDPTIKRLQCTEPNRPRLGG